MTPDRVIATDRSVIERWTIEGGLASERRLVNVGGPTIVPHAQIKMVRASDYDALADQLRGAVAALREIDGQLAAVIALGEDGDTLERLADLREHITDVLGGQ